MHIGNFESNAEIDQESSKNVRNNDLALCMGQLVHSSATFHPEYFLNSMKSGQMYIFTKIIFAQKDWVGVLKSG